MLSFFAKIFSLLQNQAKKIPLLILFFIILSLLEFIGIGLIGPYVAIITGTDSNIKFHIIIFNYLGMSLDESNQIAVLSFLLFSVFLIKSVLAIFINYKVTKFSQDVTSRLRSFLMFSYQNLSYKEFLKKNSADYIYNIQELSNRFANNVVFSLLRATGELITSIMILILLILQDPIVLLCFLSLGATLIIIWVKYFKKKLTDLGILADRSAEKIVKSVNESMNGFKEIRILNKENYFYNILSSGAKQYAVSFTILQTILNSARYLFEIIVISFIIILVISSNYYNLINQNDLFSTLSIFGVAAIRFIPAANIITNSINSIRFNLSAVSSLYVNINVIREYQFKANKNSNDSYMGEFESLELKNISFHHDNTKTTTLKNISLKIKANDTIGFIGPSGSGKTTLVDLLLGLHRPSDGEIYFNSKLLKENHINWKSQVAYLPQDVFMMDATIAENITIKNKDEISKRDIKKIQEAVKKSKLTNLVQNLPNGIDTKIGERGLRISGGQKQRLALARALYHNRNILVLDEATSALDKKTEDEIIDEIYNLKENLTIIIITHRLSTLKNCDIIYRINNGNLVESNKVNEIVD